MKRHIIYTFAALALVLSCNRAEPEQQSGDLIRIGATLADVPSTKALLNKADLQVANGAQVRIFDFLTGFQGTVTPEPDAYDGGFYYINDVITNDGNNNWSFTDNIAWRWTRTGSHKFFGWLVSDGATTGTGHAATELGITDDRFNLSTKVLSVPAITFNKTTPQFDFSYSDIVEVPVDLNSGINAPSSVNLPLNHLFSAVSFVVKNRTSDGKYTIKELAITGIRNQGSASINYQVENTADVATPIPPAIIYNTPVVSGQFVSAITDGDIVLEGDEYYDIINETSGTLPQTGFSPEFKLLWPLSEEQVSEIRITGKYEIDGNLDEYGNQIVSDLNLSLKANDKYSPWLAGHKYQYALIFTDKFVNLVYSVLPWDYVKTDIDFAQNSLSATTLRLEGGIKQGNNYIVSTTADTIEGTFQIWTPVGAVWRVSMKGDTDFFTLEDNQGTIDPSRENGLVRFRIVPNTAVKSAHPETTAKITLHFSVETSSGETLNGDTEINRDNIQIVY